MNFTEIRLKLRHFFRKNKKIILIVVLVIASILLINYLLGRRVTPIEPTTTYKPHTSIMSTSSSTPVSMQEPIEKMIDEYVEACNEGNYDKAFNMLSDDCKKYEFNDNVEKFMANVLDKMPNPKKYSIQDYSNTTLDGKKLYIYEIKYIDDILATGLTNSQYLYDIEKMAFYKDEDNNIQMATGNFIYHTDVKSISENEYLKIDVLDKTVNYSMESYEVKFTNRSDYTIVVADNVEQNEVLLKLPNEYRERGALADIVLKPKESKTVTMKFQKFADDGDTSQGIVCSAIRVMENYSGTEVEDGIIQSEINNAIAKFSMEVSVK